MITENILQIITNVTTRLWQLLTPTLEADSGFEFVDAYIYPAWHALADVPIIGAFITMLTVVGIFEVLLLAVRIAVSFARTTGIIKYSPLPYD